jgi:uncharacterized protein YbaR (Trm112 family)
MGKVVVRCPKCKKTLQVTRPDSAHEYWSLDRPREDEDVGSVVEQELTCRDADCASKFAVYWYEK